MSVIGKVFSFIQKIQLDVKFFVMEFIHVKYLGCIKLLQTKMHLINLNGRHGLAVYQVVNILVCSHLEVTSLCIKRIEFVVHITVHLNIRDGD